MKIIAVKSGETVLAEITLSEIKMLTGFTGSSEFFKAFGIELRYGSHIPVDDSMVKKMIDVPDYPICNLYTEARETLSAYEELRGKFESIRNQLNVMLQKMVKARPEPDIKK